ncbi:MAG: prepilin peptidase [Alphaproteobacteria bacterium]|nr:prepilin peptidase [Alphaproteobacteria bacterium]
MIDPLYALYAVFSVLFGLVLGSFWNVCIARWPEDRSVIHPRSQCPSCGTMVEARDNVPVVSWLLLGRKCRTCGWPIPATYPLTEVLGGLLGFLVFRRFVPTPFDLDPAHLAAAALYFVFVGALVIGSFVDIRHRILPDEVTIYAIPVGVLGCALLEVLGYTGWMAVGWRQAVVGALLGGVFFGGMALAALFVSGREALGWGDVKLLAMIGSFLGAHPAIVAVTMMASITGSVVGIGMTIWHQRRVYLPFGPNLALWALVYLLYGDELMKRFLPALFVWLPGP